MKDVRPGGAVVKSGTEWHCESKRGTLQEAGGGGRDRETGIEGRACDDAGVVRVRGTLCVPRHAHTQTQVEVAGEE